MTSGRFRRHLLLVATAGAGCLGAACGDARVSDDTPPDAVEAPPTELAALYAEAESLHAARNLGAASTRYRDLLERDPPPPLTDEDLDLAARLAPILRLHHEEPFILEDFVAILHPDDPIIGYHLFWDDDIDFPDDNEPADHEVVWISYDPVTLRAKELATYFHGEIVRRALDPEDTSGAESRGPTAVPRPPVFVEWGKHGSLPGAPLASWADWPRELEENWRRLHDEGTRRAGHPLARGWPVRFEGDFDAYRLASGTLDPVSLLLERRTALRTRWANAALNQHFLTYNFSPKPGWP